MSLHGAPLGQVDASAEFLFSRGFFSLMDAFVVVVWVLVVPVVSLDPETSRFLLFPHDASVWPRVEAARDLLGLGDDIDITKFTIETSDSDTPNFS